MKKILSTFLVSIAFISCTELKPTLEAHQGKTLKQVTVDNKVLVVRYGPRFDPFIGTRSEFFSQFEKRCDCPQPRDTTLMYLAEYHSRTKEQVGYTLLAEGENQRWHEVLYVRGVKKLPFDTVSRSGGPTGIVVVQILNHPKDTFAWGLQHNLRQWIRQ
jgi:hypothetical protein